MSFVGDARSESVLEVEAGVCERQFGGWRGV